MSSILNAIYHDDPVSQAVICNLDEPRTLEERRIVNQLRAVHDEKVADAIKETAELFADAQAERAFYTGARFGMQLAIELLESC